MSARTPKPEQERRHRKETLQERYFEAQADLAELLSSPGLFVAQDEPCCIPRLRSQAFLNDMAENSDQFAFHMNELEQNLLESELLNPNLTAS